MQWSGKRYWPARMEGSGLSWCDHLELFQVESKKEKEGFVFDSPEMEALRAAWADEELRTKASDQAWWDSLTMEERARAFRQVVSLIYKAEVKERGSYRHAIYDVFEVDYLDGMTCHYMDIHNLICKALESSSPA